MTGVSGVLVVERRGHVLVARLNRPDERNALDSELLRELGNALLLAESDPEIRAVVLTGTGDRAFCAGMDLAAFGRGEQIGVGSDEATVAYRRLMDGAMTVPVIGAANGAAIGGGFEMLLGCDVVVASETARFGLPEVKRGLFPAGGGTGLGARIPLAVALELTLTGAPIDARRAYELGIANSVVPAEDVLTAAVALADVIAANGPLAVRATKELVRLAAGDPQRWAERLEHWRSTVFTSEDAREGAEAFMAKRTPVWKGR